ncbi:MAG: cupin domain-containing protein, partial [Clostridia bacterium]|nr:cupin domain-containing protein [Clostridia bacterium]
MIHHQLYNSKKNFHYNAYIYHDGSVWNSHFHEGYELVYVIEGVLEVSLNGEKVILAPHEM